VKLVALDTYYSYGKSICIIQVSSVQLSDCNHLDIASYFHLRTHSKPVRRQLSRSLFQSLLSPKSSPQRKPYTPSLCHLLLLDCPGLGARVRHIERFSSHRLHDLVSGRWLFPRGEKENGVAGVQDLGAKYPPVQEHGVPGKVRRIKCVL
jgi:hypothetical protein